MTIYEKLAECFKGKEGQILTNEEIVSMVKVKCQAEEGSIIPSDYCYNSWNQGLRGRDARPLFIKIGRGEYQYLGPDYPYTGIITWHPRSSGRSRIVGEWVDGRRIMNDDAVLNDSPEGEKRSGDTVQSDLKTEGIDVVVRDGRSSVLFPSSAPLPSSQIPSQQEFEAYLHDLIPLLERLHAKYPIADIHFPGGGTLIGPEWFRKWCQERGIHSVIDSADAGSDLQVAEVRDHKESFPVSKEETIPLSPLQLDNLYAEYMKMLEMEVDLFGCKPTETRHLIGRLGEFHCARVTGGQLAHRVNQAGFDVISPEGRNISVKTTAQSVGFVAIKRSTVHLADELMVLRYHEGELKVVYYGDMAPAVAASRLWQERSYELDIDKARKLPSKAFVP